MRNISKFWPTHNTSHISHHFPTAMTILQILLSGAPSPWPILNWFWSNWKYVWLSIIRIFLRRWEWTGMASLLCSGSAMRGTFQIIFDVSRERFVPSNIGFRISNKWPGDHGKYIDWPEKWKYFTEFNKHYFYTQGHIWISLRSE